MWLGLYFLCYWIFPWEKDWFSIFKMLRNNNDCILQTHKMMLILIYFIKFWVIWIWLGGFFCSCDFFFIFLFEIQYVSCTYLNDSWCWLAAMSSHEPFENALFFIFSTWLLQVGWASLLSSKEQHSKKILSNAWRIIKPLFALCLLTSCWLKLDIMPTTK